MNLFLFLLAISLSFPSFAKIESSPDIFLPAAQKEFVKAYQQAPISWWNFLLFQKSNTTRDQACAELNRLGNGHLLYKPCATLPIARTWLNELAAEQILSQTPPSSIQQLQERLDLSLVSLSLPLPKESLEILRRFPLAKFDDLATPFKDFFSDNYDGSEVMVLPFLVPFSPDSEDSEKWVNQVMRDSSSSFYWAGPHFGAQLNKQQIIKDLHRVSWLGSLLVLALVGFLIVSRRPLFLVLLPILGFAMIGAFLVVHGFWGSVHGLTLAFGCGLVGISMDYAFHGWSAPYDAKVWRTNFMSFLTTLISFGLLQFFSAPLLQQISLFAMVGLTLSFCSSFLLSYFYSDQNRIPLQISYPVFPKKWVFAGSILLIFAAVGSLFFQKMDFSLQRLDLTHTEMRQQINQSNINSEKNSLGFYLSSNDDNLPMLNQWGKQTNIAILNPISFDNPAHSQNQKRWVEWVCQNANPIQQLAMQLPYQKLFPDFFTFLDCQNLKSYDPQTSQLRRLFSVGSSVLSIFKATTPEQVKLIEEQFPKVFFLTQLTEDFPQTLRQESLWFLLSCFSVSLLILFVVFRKKSVQAFIPVAGAVVCILLTNALLGRPISFISFVSVILLLGLTLDYGIFCATYNQDPLHLQRIFGSIFLSASTSLAGFAPLSFCGHPVLADLGITIVAGIGGALVFTFFIFPSLSQTKVQT